MLSLSKFSLSEAKSTPKEFDMVSIPGFKKSEPELKHRVSVTVSDPQHTMASKRHEKIEKRVKLYANDEEHAVTMAKHHFKRQGYKVHDAHHIGITEETEIDEAVTVKKQNYSWGKMVTVHHGKTTSYPLHPEHQKAIAKLKPGEKTSFKDETNSTVHAEREDDKVHLSRPRTSSTKTSVAHSHFTEQMDDKPPFEGGKVTKGTVTDKSGAKHTAMSRARHLARFSQMQQAKKLEPKSK